MQIRVGTSGWQHPHWRRTFYPEDAAPESWLGLFAETFDTVEVADTYHDLVERDVIESWCAQVPEGFEFVVDAPRRITEQKKLKHCAGELTKMHARFDAFGDRLGPILFRLPVRWRSNVRRLRAFLEALPGGRRYCFELRDPSWHTEEVAQALREHGVARCIDESQSRTMLADPPGAFVCLRLHGAGSDSDFGNFRTQELRVWRGRALAWNRRGKDVYVLFDDDDRACAARNARRFASLLNEPEAQAAAVGEC